VADDQNDGAIHKIDFHEFKFGPKDHRRHPAPVSDILALLAELERK
jgi:hypothetical protein